MGCGRTQWNKLARLGNAVSETRWEHSIEVARNTGARRGELVELRLSDVDPFSSGVLRRDEFLMKAIGLREFGRSALIRTRAHCRYAACLRCQPSVTHRSN